MKQPKIKIYIEDLWSGDHTLSLVILPFLKKFKRHYKKNYDYQGYPISLVQDPENCTPEIQQKEFLQWLDILDKMIFSFQAIVNNKFKGSVEERTAYEQRIQEGLNLFGKHFRDLWI